VLAGLGGNDSLYGGRGDDVIYGGDGINKIWGGPGEDYVVFERNQSTNGAFNKVKDWSMKDKLSFDGYIPEDVNVKGSSLFLDGNRVGFFRGMNESELEILVAAAHYSFT
jgi:Ca2+-binding RTX toxin-like protein